MSLFKNKDDNSDSWKAKYFHLLDTQDQFELACKTNEDLLRKTIVRFSLAVKGFNTELDPHLDRIRDVLKANVKSDRLKQEIDLFSNALMQLDDETHTANPDASLLFDFLATHYPAYTPELQDIQARLTNREFINNQHLFLALAKILPEQSSRPYCVIETFDSADSTLIREQLLHLLENADFPSPFSDDGQRLKSRLQGGEALSEVFKDAVTLLLSVKIHLLEEQQEMAIFLSSITEELADLGLKASGVSIAHEDAMTKRANLDHDVTAQMDDLQKSSATATALEPLKLLVSNRIHKITQQIQVHNQQEQLNRENTQHELQGMVEKIKTMESETAELKSKLEQAQQRATRDPLTHLPNRLALDERLAEDFARARRFGSPLSMAIWDIDFFKKINDTFGHKSGDKALIIIAKLLSEHCRETDFVSRVGGEEFVMLLSETTSQTALKVVDKLRQIIETSSFNANGKKISITLSCGVTQYIDGDSFETFFERADSALYQAKQCGRNQCVLI